MASDGWIIVPGWDKFQHYHDRNPAWIKLYTELRDRDEWRQLTLAARGLLVCIWMEYAASGGQLRTSDISSRVAQKFPRRTLDSLLEAGLLEVSASKPLARRYTREEKRREESPKGSYSKTVDNSEAQREKTKRKVKAWLANTATELEGVDLAYVLADEFKIEDQDLLADLIAYAQENYLLKRRD